MTNNEIKTVGQTIAAETQIGGNTAGRVGGVIEGIGYALDNKDAANGYYQATINGGSISVNAPNYVLGTSGNLRLKMPAAGTTASTLSIGNANAVQLWYNGAAVSSDNTWEAEEIISVFYDGTRFMASNSQGGGGAAENIRYNNSLGYLSATNVQDGIDELSQNVAKQDYLPYQWTAMTTSSMSIVSGYSLVSTGLVSGGARSVYRLLTSQFKQVPRKIRITAQSNVDAGIAFAQGHSGTTLWFADSASTSYHLIPRGTTQEFEIQENAMYIYINNYSTANVFPDYLGLMFDEIDGGDLKEYINIKTIDYSDYGKVYYNNEILFTNEEVPAGTQFSWEVILQGVLDGTDNTGYISLYDANGTRLSYFGKASRLASDITLNGSATIPKGFSYAKMVTSITTGTQFVMKTSYDYYVKGNLCNYSEYDLSSATSVNDCFINVTTKAWDTNAIEANRVWKLITIPSGAEYMKIVPSEATILLAFLASWTTPVNGLYPDYAEENATTHYFSAPSEVKLPPNAKYVVIMTHNTTIDVSPVYVGFGSSSTMLGRTLLQEDELYENGREVESVSCPNAAIQVMATDDEDATEYDNLLIGYNNVLKVNDSLFYMYYSCFGQDDDYSTDQNQHLAFAYSTDGLNWTRAIPTGISAPIPNTNLIFQDKVVGAQVFKVMDNDYPYRMIASYNRLETCMFKSADGVNFEKIRTIFNYFCDNQVSCIVRGGIIKVYIRWRSNATGTSSVDNSYRWVGVFTVDIDGNLICPTTLFWGLNIYQASASILDDRREIAFPTYFNFNVDEQEIRCYIIEGKSIKRLNFDASNMFGNDEHSYYVAPNLINIGDKMYAYVTCRTCSHNGFNTSNVARVKRIEVVYDTIGTYWAN